MQVILGPLVSDAAGSIGGSTFMRNPVAAIVRARRTPTNRRTRYTAVQRPNIQFLSRQWRTLSNADRALWQTEADAQVWLNRFGVVIRGLGYWLFVRCNQYLQEHNGTLVTVPGTLAPLDAITDAAGDFSAVNTWPITWTLPAAVGADQYWHVYASRWCSPGRTNARRQTRYIGYIRNGQPSGINLYAAYVARFGQAPPVGQIVFVTLLPVMFTEGYPGTPVSFIANT